MCGQPRARKTSRSSTSRSNRPRSALCSASGGRNSWWRRSSTRHCEIVGWVERSDTHHLAAYSTPLAKLPVEAETIACPILWIDTVSHHAMKRRIRPIADTFHKPMFDGVDVNIIDVARKIALVANRVLPIASLPDTTFAFADTAA